MALWKNLGLKEPADLIRIDSPVHTGRFFMYPHHPLKLSHHPDRGMLIETQQQESDYEQKET